MSTKNTEKVIKSVHPFPARMAPPIIEELIPRARKPLKILDPMAGSGTTLVYAKKAGHFAIGCDLDPLALLIADVWCSSISEEYFLSHAKSVLEKARKIVQHDEINAKCYYNFDVDTKKFIDFWYDEETKKELIALATCISRVRNKVHKRALWCTFSRMIITKSVGVSLAKDVSHSRPHRSYLTAPVKPFDVFIKSASLLVKRMPFNNISYSVKNHVILNGDARTLPIKRNSIDCIITSPPYLNAIDYMRGHKLALVWMGFSIEKLRAIRSKNIGSEISTSLTNNNDLKKILSHITDIRKLTNRQIGILSNYVLDMFNMLNESSRVLVRHGTATYVVGNSNLKGAFIRNSDVITCISKLLGLEIVSQTTRTIEAKHRYLPPPISDDCNDGISNRIFEEVIITLRKNS